MIASDRPCSSVSQLAHRALEVDVSHAVRAVGLAPALVSHRLAEHGRKVLHVTADLESATRAQADLRFLRRSPTLGPEALRQVGEALLFAPPEGDAYAEVHQDRRAAMSRTATLARLCGDTWSTLCVPASALVRKTVPASLIREATLVLELGSAVDTQDLAKRLTAAGWLRAPVVEDPGSFALRGGLLDVWAAGTPEPVRVELDFDRIERMRGFDPDDQRTGERSYERLVLPPARETVLSPERSAKASDALRDLCDAVNLPSTKARVLVNDLVAGTTFFGAEAYLPAFTNLVPLIDYLPADALVVFEQPERVLSAIDRELERALDSELAMSSKPHFPVDSLFSDRTELREALGARHLVALHSSGISGEEERPLAHLAAAPIDAPSLEFEDQSELSNAIKQARHSGGGQNALDPLIERIETWRESGLSVSIAARVATQAHRLEQLLKHRGVELNVEVGDLARGAVAPLEGFAIITEEEVFGQRAHRQKAKKKTTRGILEDLRALNPGDFVVHVEHGIGRYLGLEHKQVGSTLVDLLTVEYFGGDKLFLPVYRLNQIQKYSGGDGTPRLDRLGGSSFAKTKAKVQKRVRQMADELLKLYAERNAAQKQPIDALDDEYRAFEATFPYEETRDQAAAIQEVNQDLESERVMDRLVCGDVGFGKTEVAIRAAFRAAMNGRQVALLCPTTVLAQQHANTFRARLEDYALSVKSLSRFVSKKQQTETLKGLKEGAVDIVVGTHRLLSKDVHFKNLGLLIVDEEQRFGVTHKERIKQMKASVDVLTLSATPIPRTLQLAIGGLRDMSIISTAPVDRRAVRTITSRWDEKLVREAITSELSRGGQVFYVYNRVEGIYERAAKLTELLPEARIAVGHGQLSETALEKTMLGFVEGQYDILVATAIVESGLDIPRANTIIIDRADLFGLSQLYQLRGRVGRSSERAYCYLLVPPAAQMTEESRNRIEALERYHELGSGFHVASLDMEQRGAGDLLGGEQSGFVASVGFDLFCQMLEEATRELRGEEVRHEIDPDLSFDVDALLPEDYVAEVGVRLSLYKRLASAQDAGEVQQIGAEMEDRFGPAPREAISMVELMRLKSELRAFRVLGCEASAKSVTLHLAQDTPLDPVAVGRLVGDKASGYRLTPDMRLTRRLKSGEVAQNGLELCDRMLEELTPHLRSDP
ncbi:MAG: transcription-repair coupling factor [Polyangiaceae bacterium]|nr:transcription-repair coupling factor [Polyangiaceae bacterium]MCB9606442.1 transcription-repair coupling factor [Polyangiaceae bacterium]